MAPKKNSPLPEGYGVAVYDQWEGEGRKLAKGDKVKVQLPLLSYQKVVVFNGYHVPERGKPYIEVVEDGYRLRCIAPDQIKAKKRRMRSVA